jgi:hypothetical protein
MNIHQRIILSLEAAKTCGSLSKRSEAVNQKNMGQMQGKRLHRLLAVSRPASVQYRRLPYSSVNIAVSRVASMAKELPILGSTALPTDTAQTEPFQYARVFCQKENSPPLRLLLEFLTSRAQTPITPPDMDDTMLDEWAWVQVTLGYDRNRKPIQVCCVRDRGTYQDVFEKEKEQFLEIISAHDDVEAELVRAYVERARFVLTTRFSQTDMSDEGYDFNGWILEFYQDQCNGIVQIDNQGFYSPKGDLIVDLSIKVE